MLTLKIEGWAATYGHEETLTSIPSCQNLKLGM